MEDILDRIRIYLAFIPEGESKALATLVAIFILWLLRRVVLFFSLRKTEDVADQYHWRKGTMYVAVLLALFIIGRIWYSGFSTISTYLGLLSAGVAIALQDPLANLAGWVFILWRRPFEVGDRVQIGEHRGDVVDQRIFVFTLMEIGNWVEAEQSTGRVIHIPNGKVFREVLANYSKGFQYIWNEIPVLITYESNWQKAKEILLKIGSDHAEHLSKSAERRVKRAAKKLMIIYNKLTPIVYTKIKESGVQLTIRYLCEPRRRRDSEQEIEEDILDAFNKCDDIDFAYPTQRFYDNTTEGKQPSKSQTDKIPNAEKPQVKNAKRR